MLHHRWSVLSNGITDVVLLWKNSDIACWNKFMLVPWKVPSDVNVIWIVICVVMCWDSFMWKYWTSVVFVLHNGQEMLTYNWDKNYVFSQFSFFSFSHILKVPSTLASSWLIMQKNKTEWYWECWLNADTVILYIWSSPVIFMRASHTWVQI